jgi:hypothetical protein
MHFLYVFTLQFLYNSTYYERTFRSSSGVHKFNVFCSSVQTTLIRYNNWSKYVLICARLKWMKCGAWYCMNRVSSCNIRYVVQRDTQLLLYANIYSQYIWLLDMFRTYRSILRTSALPYVRRLFHNLLTYGHTKVVPQPPNVWTHQGCSTTS